jgi:hypothetical protein
MKRQTASVFVAIFLILIGIIALLDNLSILPFYAYGIQWLWLGAFGLAGVLFLAAFVSNRQESWWAAIPGFALLGLAVLSGIPAFAESALGGGFFLGMISLSFWVIYFTHREQWWAVIPGGVLLTLAVTAVLPESTGGGQDAGGFFFLGLGLTFLLVYLLPTPEGRKDWAIWPAAILGLMGALISLGSSGWSRFIWPVALIALGGFIIYRTFTRRVE